MIKCTYFSKLLKQSLFTLLIGFFGFGLGSFVSADSEWSFYNVDSSYPVGGDLTFSFRPISSSTTILEGGGMTESKALIYNYNKIGTKNYTTLYFWGLDSVLYSCENPSYSSTVKNCFVVNNFCRYNGTEFTSDSYGNLCRNGTVVSSGSVYNDSSLKGEMTQIAFLTYSSSFSQSSNSNAMCFVYGDLGFSLCYKNSTVSPTYYSVSTSIAGTSLNPVEFDYNIIGTSPWVSGGSSQNNNPIGNPDFEDGYNYTPIESGDIVFYFENNPYYKFDENLCYVGLDSSDFDILYNTGNSVAFMKGNNYGNIFDLFSYFFGNTFTIKNVGSFINAWDLNYDEYYNYAEYGYNSYYSLGSGFYQEFGENLQNPFVGNSLGLFFMGFNVNKYGRYNTIGEEIATYCYYKLGLDENSDLYNITDNSDSSYRNNAGGFIDNRNRSHVYFSGADSIQSQSREGTPLQYLSGDDNLDFSTFFSKSFNRFKDSFTINPNDFGPGFLPTYIILFLLAIIVFRFISH